MTGLVLSLPTWKQPRLLRKKCGPKEENPSCHKDKRDLRFRTPAASSCVADVTGNVSTPQSHLGTGGVTSRNARGAGVRAELVESPLAGAGDTARCSEMRPGRPRRRDGKERSPFSTGSAQTHGHF